jgi:outer membrane receptor protein involved in Fe transport
VGSFYCKQFSPTAYFGFCQSPYGTNFQTRAAATSAIATGSRSRINLSYHVTPDVLLYATWSQGFRAGAFNRSTSCHLPDPVTHINRFCVPAYTVPDNVTNKEFGWKTEWMGHRIQFNGAVYQEDWTNAQTGFFDPQGGLGNLAFSTNGPSYRIKGIEPSLIARVVSGLTVQAAASWNSSSESKSPYLIANNPALLGNPASAGLYGQPITSIQNPYGPLGSPTSYSPSFKFFGRIRYDWNVNDYTAFVQASGDHQTHMSTGSGYVPGYDIPGFATYAASAGFSKDRWSVEIYAQNLTNVNASVSTGSGQFVLAEVPIRPRVLGLKINYGWQEK